jgi:hypothetical protein
VTACEDSGIGFERESDKSERDRRFLPFLDSPSSRSLPFVSLRTAGGYDHHWPSTGRGKNDYENERKEERKTKGG